MTSNDFDEKGETIAFQSHRSHEEHHQRGAHEGGSLESGGQERNMASGSARYMRYILFAVFVGLLPMTDPVECKFC